MQLLAVGLYEIRGAACIFCGVRILILMNVDNSQGGQPLRTHSAAKRSFKSLHAAKTALSSAGCQDTKAE